MSPTQETVELCEWIRAANRQADRSDDMQRRLRAWWLEADRSSEDARAVLDVRFDPWPVVWGGEPCRVIEPRIWAQIWRRAGFISIGGHTQPTAPTRVYRSAEPAVIRALSWTPDRGYAEMWREVTKGDVPSVEDAGRAVYEILAGNGKAGPGLSVTGEAVNTYSAVAPPDAVLAILENPRGVLEYVCDPDLLEDIQQIEPDRDAARQFVEKCQSNIDDFPPLTRANDGTFYWRLDDGYHKIIDVPEFVRLGKQHGHDFAFMLVCDLCEAKTVTPRLYEDDVCWIADCVICRVPMVVYREHQKNPPASALRHMHEKLAAVTSFDHYVDDRMRMIPDHYHAHARTRTQRKRKPADRPAIYCDFDGVFFPHGKRSFIDSSLINSLTATFACLDVDIYWLTMRGENVPDLWFKAHVIDMPSSWPKATWLAEDASWWKLRRIQERATATGRPFVWLDDHLDRVPAAREWADSLTIPNLLVAPEPTVGLTDVDVKTIGDFLATI